MFSLLLTLALTSSRTGGSPTTANAAGAGKQEGFRIIHVADLAALLADKSKPTFLFDANHDEFRAQEGIIPGAKLLASSSSYDVGATLPKDLNARLVFYCSERL